MEIGSFFKPVVYALLGVLGLVTVLVPYVSYDEAYFVGEDYYITMCDSVEVGYEPYVKDLVQRERTEFAYAEKRDVFNKVKPVSDSLQFVLNKATINKDSAKIKELNSIIMDLNFKTDEKVAAIMEKYSLDKMPKAQLEAKVAAIKDTLSMDQYILVVANQIRNPNGLSTIADVKQEDIKRKKVNLQDKGGYLIVGLVLIGLVAFMLLMEKELIPLHQEPLKIGGIVIFFGLAIILGFKSYGSLADDIEFKKIFEARELVVREKLVQIKDIQVEYLGAKEEYCSNWDTLINYVKNDSASIVRYLVDKNDTAAVNNALRNNQPIKDTTFIPIHTKVFGEGHSVNLDSLAFVPFTAKKFELQTRKAKNANNRDVFFIEVKTKKKNFVDMLEIYPENFDEDIFIQIGSLAEPTTEGNW